MITPMKCPSEARKASTESKQNVPGKNNKVISYPKNSYQVDQKQEIDPNLMRMGSNRTTNQLSILIKKRKERMANAASFASLSRFSQPNNSESSFRNAYQEYRNGMMIKAKRKDSPLTKLEKNKINMVPSRNKTRDIVGTAEHENNNNISFDHEGIELHE